MNNWDKFFREKITKIFTEKIEILDIGGGLRIDKNKNNRENENNNWIKEYLPKVNYKVLDKVADYNPDIVGDVHELPLGDNTQDAVICIAVLEHVENPHQAMKEIYRVLKPGGYLFLYVPFLFYYHPMKGYYGDYYRFTYEGVKYLAKDFSDIEVQNVRGALSTVFNLLPIFSKKTKIFDLLDVLLKKSNSKQTSGYNLFAKK